MTQRIRFDNDVPHWLRRLCRRWFRLLLPDDWRMRICMQDADEMAEEHGEGTAAVLADLPLVVAGPVDLVHGKRRHFHGAVVKAPCGGEHNG